MRRILVAEDSATQAAALEAALTEASFDVDVARDGRAALAMVRTQRYDAVVSDVVMPLLSGLELCQEIRADERIRAVPVVLLTTLDDPAAVLRGIQAGADTYVTKPYEADDLIARLRALIDRGVTPRAALATTADASFMGQRFQLSFDATQMLHYFLSSFEDYVRARAREEVERQSNESLREALRFVESTFDALSVQIAILDSGGKILAANATWLRFAEKFGLREQGWVVGVNYLDQLANVTGSDREEAAALATGIRGVLERERDTFALQYARCDTVEERWCNIHVTRFELAEQTRVVVAHEDVTEQTRALRRQRAQFTVTRTLADATSLDDAGPALLQAMCHGVGWDVGELWLVDGQRLWQTASWSDPFTGVPANDDHAPTPELRVGEGLEGRAWKLSSAQWVEDLRLEASDRDSLARNSRLRSGVAVPVGRGDAVAGVLVFLSIRSRSEDPVTIAVLEDVCDQIAQFLARRSAQTALEQRAEELARSEGMLRCILDSAADGIIVADETGTLLTNRAAEALVGQGVSQAGPSPLGTLGVFLADETTRIGEQELPLARATRGEATNDVELFVRTADAAQGVHVSMSGRPLIGPGGAVAGGVVVFRDLTEKREALRALAQREEQLRKAQRLEAVGRLAGGIAHDFNNLLTAMMSYATFLASSLEPETTAYEDAHEILRAAERASSLTRQLLSFSRRQILQRRVFDVRDVLQDMENLLRRLVGEQVRLTLDLADASCRVEADPGQFEQIVVNLAVNARDAMPQGGELTIRAERAHLSNPPSPSGSLPKGYYVILTVSDTGTGMSSEVKNQIFEPFFTTKEKGHGTGLGLATVHGIVHQSGGHIEVESSPGHGTTFRVYLRETDQELSESLPPAPLSMQPLSAANVLLVDDDDEVRRAASRALRRAGYTVIDAGSPGEALLLAERESSRVTLLLTDLVMPLMSGADLYERVLKLVPGVRVVFMSGYATSDMLDTLPAGAPILRKPFAPEDLTRAIEDAIRAADYA